MDRARRGHRRRAADGRGFSILRDWLKGQVTAIEVGLMSFEAAFLPNLITGDGRSVMERIEAGGLLALPPPS